MKLVLKDRSKPPFDVASGEAPLYLNSGLYEQYVPATPKAVPNSKWNTSRGNRDADYEEQPRIHWFCSTCGLRAILEGRTCHKTQQMRHCNVVESVPTEIGVKFAELYKSWSARFQRKPVQRPKTHNTVLVP